MRTITLYSQPECHLCDRAKDVLARARRQVDFALEIRDISQEAELLTRYGHDIPVILLDGVEIARHFVREQQVLELLRRNDP